MSYPMPPTSAEAPHPYRYACIACTTLDTGENPTIIRTDRDELGQYAICCERCSARLTDARFRTAVEIAAIVRVSVRDVLAVLGHVTAHRATGPEHFTRILRDADRALGLPVGSAARVLGEFAARHRRQGVAP